MQESAYVPLQTHHIRQLAQDTQTAESARTKLVWTLYSLGFDLEIRGYQIQGQDQTVRQLFPFVGSLMHSPDRFQ
jgi:hypothetical protein